MTTADTYALDYLLGLPVPAAAVREFEEARAAADAAAAAVAAAKKPAAPRVVTHNGGCAPMVARYE